MAVLRLYADRARLATIRDFVAKVGHELGLDKRVVYDLQLAIDEACTNVVEHGYGGRGGEIEIGVEAAKDGVGVIVRDWGATFNPQAVPEPDVTAPLEQRRLGGLGLFLMRQVMDDVHFEFGAENGNTLTMFKRHRGEEEISEHNRVSSTGPSTSDDSARGRHA